jgi:hypothetical protein
VKCEAQDYSKKSWYSTLGSIVQGRLAHIVVLDGIHPKQTLRLVEACGLKLLIKQHVDVP